MLYITEWYNIVYNLLPNGLKYTNTLSIPHFLDAAFGSIGANGRHHTGRLFILRVAMKSLGQGERPTVLINMMDKLPRVIGIGAAMLILTGIGLTILTHGVFGEQIWFRIEFGLVILIILNGLLIGRRQGVKLRRIFDNSKPDQTGQFHKVKSRLGRFYLTQLLLFLLIIFLSVFKFN